MRIRAFAAAAVVLPVAFGSLAIAPAEDAACYVVDEGDPATPEDDVEVCRADGWFTGNQTRVGNLGATDADDFPSWDDTAPTGSYQAGAGSMYVGEAMLDYTEASLMDPRVSATYEGTFTGDIDSITVRQYIISPVDHYVFGEYGLRIRFEVDGQELYESVWVDGDFVPLTEAADGVAYFELALVDLYDGVPSVQDGPDAEHDVRIIISPYGPNDDGLFVYDAAEVPSGLVFNQAPDEIKWFYQVRP